MPTEELYTSTYINPSNRIDVRPVPAVIGGIVGLIAVNMIFGRQAGLIARGIGVLAGISAAVAVDERVNPHNAAGLLLPMGPFGGAGV